MTSLEFSLIQGVSPISQTLQTRNNAKLTFLKDYLWKLCILMILWDWWALSPKLGLPLLVTRWNTIQIGFVAVSANWAFSVRISSPVWSTKSGLTVISKHNSNDVANKPLETIYVQIVSQSPRFLEVYLWECLLTRSKLYRRWGHYMVASGPKIKTECNKRNGARECDEPMGSQHDCLQKQQNKHL